MPVVSKQEVQRIALLARLRLTEEEVASATRQLSSILDHFSTIQNVDTKSVPTSDDVTGLTNVTREDRPQPSALCSVQSLLDAAPETDQGHIKVKAVF